MYCKFIFVSSVEIICLGPESTVVGHVKVCGSDEVGTGVASNLFPSFALRTKTKTDF